MSRLVIWIASEVARQLDFGLEDQTEVLLSYHLNCHLLERIRSKQLRCVCAEIDGVFCDGVPTDHVES